MGNIFSRDILGEVEVVCRQADQYRLQDMADTAELSENTLRRTLSLEGYKRDSIDDMFAYAMGRILHEDIERELKGE